MCEASQEIVSFFFLFQK